MINDELVKSENEKLLNKLNKKIRIYKLIVIIGIVITLVIKTEEPILKVFFIGFFIALWFMVRLGDSLTFNKVKAIKNNTYKLMEVTIKGYERDYYDNDTGMNINSVPVCYLNFEETKLVYKIKDSFEEKKYPVGEKVIIQIITVGTLEYIINVIKSN